MQKTAGVNALPGQKQAERAIKRGIKGAVERTQPCSLCRKETPGMHRGKTKEKGQFRMRYQRHRREESKGVNVIEMTALRKADPL